MRRPFHRLRRVAVASGAAIVVLAPAVTPGVDASVPPSPAHLVVAGLEVVSQDIELAVDDVFDVVVRLPVGFDATTLGTDGATDVRVAAYSPVSPDTLGTARNAVRTTRQSARPGGRVEDFLDLSLDPVAASVAIERLGTDQLRLSVPTESATSTPGALQLPSEGVHPIVIDLRIDSVVRAEVITFVHRRAADPATVTPLALSFLVGQTSSPTLGPDGRPMLSEAEAADLTQLAAMLEAMDAAPAAVGLAAGTTPPRAVRIEPATLTAVQREDPELFARLLPLLQRSDVLSSPRLPLDLAGTVTAGRGAVFTEWLREGEDEVAALTGVLPDRSLLFADGELSDGAVALARDLNTRAVVMPAELYESTEGQIGDFANIDQLQTIELLGGGTIPAIRLDPELSSRLASIATPTLQDAIDIVAELLAFREDIETRGSAIARSGLLLARPDGGVIDPTLAAWLVQLLVQVEGVRLVSPSELPTLMDDQLVDGSPKALTLATDTSENPTPRFDLVDTIGAEAFAMADMLPADHPSIGAWGVVLDAMPSIALTDADVDAMIVSLRDQFAVYRNGIRSADNRFTLTGSTSDVPVRVENTTDTDLTVRLGLTGAKFDDFDSPVVTIPAQSELDVTIRFHALSNGSSQVILRFFTPNTETQIGEDVILTANVRAFTGLGQLVTGAGLLVLATWWVRHWRMARRRRRNETVSARHPAGRGRDEADEPSGASPSEDAPSGDAPRADDPVAVEASTGGPPAPDDPESPPDGQ